MSTNSDLITDALRVIGVLDEIQVASDEQAVGALRFANDIAEDWAENGVNVNWSPQTDATDDLMLVGAERSAFLYELALRLCPIYGKEPSRLVIALAVNSYNRLLRSTLNRNLEPIEAQMPASDASRGFVDITTL